MPTILRVNGYQFYFSAEEGNEPPHIHVAKGGFDAKFCLSRRSQSVGALACSRLWAWTCLCCPNHRASGRELMSASLKPVTDRRSRSAEHPLCVFPDHYLRLGNRPLGRAGCWAGTSRSGCSALRGRENTPAGIWRL